MKKSLILIFIILFLDQTLKIWIKTNMYLGEEFSIIGNWCKIHFIENKGMAFGMAFGGDIGKFLLTLFRVIASILIFVYLKRIIARKDSMLTVYSMTLIFAGAVGNIIDSIFYGVIFSESTFFNIAQIFPSEGAYGTFFHGKVVDMFYLPIIDTTYPSWFPFVGGEPFSFFNAIFNIADISISVGVCLLVISLIFFPKKNDKANEEKIDNSIEKQEVDITEK
ncbi:MAG: peptidase [Bacteroidetes bacterium]|nr:peptidase [Bacteroidota bacterium]